MIIMKKLSSLLISCSLALAGAAVAQQPAEQQSPSKGKHAQENAHGTHAQPGRNAPKPQERPAPQTRATNQHATTNEPGGAKGQKNRPGHDSTNTANANAETKQVEHTNEPAAGKARKDQGQQESAKASERGTDASGRTAAAPELIGTEHGKHKPGQGVKQPAAKAGARAKKPAPQQVQQVKAQHASFKAQPKPQQVQAVTFNQNHRIEGSEHWQGHQYEVFRSYHPEWHDQGWYHSHYPNVTLIAGGYYFFNNGYWFPAWGYSPSAQYYAYDGPIYVGQRAEPPDRVIADTQALLQQMGYYTGEVDGLLGPLTRQALAAYQADNGLN